MVAALYTRYIPPDPSAKPAKYLPSTTSESGLSSTKKRKRATKEKASKKKHKSDGEGSSANQQSNDTNGTNQKTSKELAEGEAGSDANHVEKSARKRHSAKVEKMKHADKVVDGSIHTDEHNGIKHGSQTNPEMKRANKSKESKQVGSEQDHAEEEQGTAYVDGAAGRHKKILSKYQKSVERKHSQRAKSPTPATSNPDPPADQLHDLVPIPVPEATREEAVGPTFSSLPEWQSHPIIASSKNRQEFKSMSVDEDLVRNLSRKGHDQALPIQSCVLPLLLPVPGQHTGDICVSATTGSGKTLAYILPILQSLKSRTTDQLQAVIVVPTRELVTQVREVAETTASGLGLKIGTAVGNHNFPHEQEALVKKGWRFDLDTYRERIRHRNESQSYQSDDIDQADLEDSEPESDEDSVLPGHVREYHSQVDILICTPGRLVEHVKSTKGFTLKNLKWLVIDEADRLLGESFQEWATVIREAMHVTIEDVLPKNLIDHPVFSHFTRNIMPERVRKVLLSATMTRDVDTLSALNLWNPRMVVLEHQEHDHERTGETATHEGLQLPGKLEEFGIPVKDPSRKPLYLWHILNNLMPLVDPLPKRAKALFELPPSKTRDAERVDDGRSSKNDSDSSHSNSSSSNGDSSSSSSTDSSKAEDSSSEASSSDTEQADQVGSSNVAKGSKAQDPESQPPSTTSPTVLIFTSSNESATRLSALLSHLDPTLTPVLATLTKTTTTSARSLSSAIQSGRTRLVVATDRAARGLDLPHLGNVINYDVPRSVNSYIHRVGRTARAGRAGRAWTMVEDREGAWFWKDVAKGSSIDRGIMVVRRINLDANVFGEEVVRKYEEALERLKEDVRS